MKLVLSFSLLLAASVEGAVFTNRWTAAAGGDWADGANWADPVMLGTNKATRAFFDLSGLPSGTTATIPAGCSGGVETYGIKIGSPGGDAADTWLLDVATENGNQNIFSFNPDPDTSALPVFEVASGVVRVNGKMVSPYDNLTVVKMGQGDLRPVKGESTVSFRLVEGRLNIIDSGVLRTSVVNLYAPNAGFSFADWLDEFFLRWLDSSTGLGTPVDLQGRHIRLNGTSDDAQLSCNLLAGDGMISASSCCRLTVKATQTDFTGVWRLGMGDVVFSSPITGLHTLYRFESANQPGAASRAGTDLTPVGPVAVVSDAARGSVLSLDGTCHLASPDPATLPPGLRTGKGPYTVACWLRIGSGCSATATLYYLGKWSRDGACNLLRLDSGSNGLRGVMYTNFGNNRLVANAATESLYDGAWHHLAVVHEGTSSSLWIDGVQADRCETDIVDVADGEFWIGYGKNEQHFTGQIDDFAFLGGALGAVEIGRLMDGSLYETSSAGPLPANSIEAYAGGAMVLEDAATVKTLTGTGSRAEICLAGDLAVQGSGTADEQTTFAGRITGAGDFVKKGADYTLALTGANTYEGATRVAEGTLELAGPRRMRGLVGRWTFEDVARPGADASGNGFDLEGGNVTVVEDPERGRVASFNGAAALASANYPAAFPFGDEGYTVSLWLKGSPSGNGSAGVVAWGKLGVDHQCVLWRLDPKVGWMMTNWNHNHNGDGTSFRDDAWHHVVWVCDEVQNSVSIDGGDPITWTRETAPSVVLDETTFYLGFNPFSGLHFTGLMDDVRVYKGALTDAEARAEHRGAVAQEQIFAEDFPKPVYEWSFEDAAAPGANTGTAEDGQLDVVGNARCSEVAGRPGKVLDLTGDTMSYLEAGTFPAACPRDATNWSVTFWERTLNLDDVDQTHDAMLYWGDPERQFLLFGFRSRNGTFRVTNMGFSDTYAHGFSLVPRGARAQWHHVAVTYHGTRLSIFIDGAPYASGDMTLQDVGDKYFWIGRKASSDTAWFRGYLDDVRIYDRALSAKMIRQMIRAEQAASILPETTAVEVAENAELVVSMADQRVASLAGAGVVRVDAGAVLEVAESGVFEGTLELAALDRLSLPAGTTLRARTAVVDGARLKSGVYPCGAGVLRVGGDLGTVVIVR